MEDLPEVQHGVEEGVLGQLVEAGAGGAHPRQRHQVQLRQHLPGLRGVNNKANHVFFMGFWTKFKVFETCFSKFYAEIRICIAFG